MLTSRKMLMISTCTGEWCVCVALSLSCSETRGFCFVIMKTRESACKILDKTDHFIDDKTVECKQALPHEDYQVLLLPLVFVLTFIQCRQKKTELRKCLLVECLLTWKRTRLTITLPSLERWVALMILYAHSMFL